MDADNETFEHSIGIEEYKIDHELIVRWIHGGPDESSIVDITRGDVDRLYQALEHITRTQVRVMNMLAASMGDDKTNMHRAALEYSGSVVKGVNAARTFVANIMSRETTRGEGAASPADVHDD